MIMIPDDLTVIHTLDPLRKAQQAGDPVAAKTALDLLLDEHMSAHPAFQALYGVSLLLSGETEAGKKGLQAILCETPRFSSWASDLGFGLFLTGDLKKAREALEQAITLPAPDAAAFNRLGAITLLLDDLAGAKSAFLNALLIDPDKAEIHSNLGGVLARLGELSEALSYYEKALSLMPDLPQAKSGRHAILIEQGRSDIVILDIEEEIEKEVDPEKIQAKTRYLAARLHSAGRFEEAVQRLRELIYKNSEDILSLIQLAGLLADRSLHQAALAVLKQAKTRDPENIVVLSMMVKSLTETEQLDQALSCVEALFAHHPEAPLSYIARATVLSALDAHGDAEKDLRHITDHFPGMVEGWTLLGHHLMVAGQMDEASTCFENASSLNPFAFSNLIEARIFPDDPTVLEKLELFSKNPLHHAESRAAMSFSLCRVFEKNQEYEKALRCAERGNTLAMRAHAYNEEKFLKMAEEIQTIFTPELFKKFNGAGSPSTRPIFIVGLPRSGTTLTEQIIASHPAVFGAGELGYIPSITLLMPRVAKSRLAFPGCMKEFEPWMAAHGASYYLKKIFAMNREKVRVTDKLPHNFLYLGLIAILFPRAKIIHLTRDPRDVAVSAFFTHFKYRDGIMGFASDLKTIGRMIRLHDRLMAHFRSVLPVPVYGLSYEALIGHPEPVLRDLFSFLDLHWDERVLDFHREKRPVKTASLWQVRQPLYRSALDRWKNYEPFLSTLFDTLG